MCNKYKYYNIVLYLHIEKIHLFNLLFAENDDEQDLTEFLDAKSFLKYNKEPWPEVIEKWKVTSVRRLREAYNVNQVSNDDEICNKNTKCHSLIIGWPLIKDKLGYSLLALDFKQLYQLEENCFFEEWEKYKPVLKQNLRVDVKDKKVNCEYGRYFEKGTSLEGKFIVLLLF